jgi:hypothetical protein
MPNAKDPSMSGDNRTRQAPYIPTVPFFVNEFIFYRKYRAHSAQNARQFIGELLEN